MSEPGTELHALVLAAGASRRFGAIKQLARIGHEPMLLHAVRCAAAAADRTWVILGAHADELAALLERAPVTVCVNANWPEGLSSSIRAGIERLPDSCDGALLALADQALLTAEQYARLAQVWRGAPQSIAAARYGARPGAPAIFPRRLFGDLLRLAGDAGARALLRDHADEVLEVPMPSAGVDIDTPADLAALGKSTLS
ncbi:MAG: nucleotidyltransferase family protein [Steroidobacteraceae bacterium]